MANVISLGENVIVKTLTRTRGVVCVRHDHCLPISNDSSPYEKNLRVAVECLKAGGVIAVPTDTIYGICCVAQNRAATDRIYSIKERDVLKPLAISVFDIPDIYKWAQVTVPDVLLRDLLPGPVTVVLERLATLNHGLNPGTSRIGIRVPDSGFVRDLCRACDAPLALTSANISSYESSLCVQDFKELWPRLDHVFDGGVLGTSKSGSTVVDLSKSGVYKIIRDGSACRQTVDILTRHGLQEH